MCLGIAIIVVNDRGEPKIFAKPGNGSHDILLSEMVPVELHNNYIKVELIYPGTIRLDAPDRRCREMALETGFVEETGLGNVIRIKAEIAEKIYAYLASNPNVLQYSRNLMQSADLVGADLVGVDLSRANLFRADLSGANLSRANLYKADLSRANLSRANLYKADLSRADLREIIYSKITIKGLKAAYLENALLSDDLKKLVERKT